MNINTRVAFGLLKAKGSFSGNTGTQAVAAPASGRIVVDYQHISTTAASVFQLKTANGTDEGPTLGSTSDCSTDHSDATVIAAAGEALNFDSTGGGKYYLEYHIEGAGFIPVESTR